jgi:hypothetical protein
MRAVTEAVEAARTAQGANNAAYFFGSHVGPGLPPALAPPPGFCPASSRARNQRNGTKQALLEHKDTPGGSQAAGPKPIS